MPTSFANHDDDATVRAPEVESISAVTLVTADMARAVRFYEALGFRRRTRPVTVDSGQKQATGIWVSGGASYTRARKARGWSRAKVIWEMSVHSTLPGLLVPCRSPLLSIPGKSH